MTLPLALSSRSYASTQIDLPDEVAEKLKAFGKTIAPDDLDEKGLEDDAHVTVKYGLHSDSPKIVKDAIDGEMPVRFMLGRTKVFPANERRKSDALVAEVHSPDLHHLNQKIASASPHVDTYADYMPHATIGYLKAGRGEKYADRYDLRGIEGMADTVTHSSSDGKKNKIKLTGTSRSPRIAASGDSAVIALSTDPAKPALVIGQGLPTEIQGQPVHYLRKEIARVGHYVHRGQRDASGKRMEFDIPAERLDKWHRNFQLRKAAGIRPFIPHRHVTDAGEYIENENDARANFGYAVDSQREGDGLFATLQIIGDKALAVAAANDVSIYVDRDSVDASGNEYDECIKHICLTPDPIIPHLQPFTRIAASADQPSRDVPVFVLAAFSQDGSPDMDPKTIQSLRDKFGWGKEIPDDQIPGKAAEKAIALSADVGTLTTQRDALTTERDKLKADVTAKEQQVLSLSADAPRRPDDITMAMYSDNVAAKREAAIKSGAITEAQAKVFDGLIADAAGKLMPLALSACGTDRKPLAFKLWDAIGQLSADGVRTGNAVPRGAEAAAALLLSGDDGKDKKPTLAEINEARKLHGLEPRTV